MPSAFVLGQDVGLSFELGVRGGGARLDDNLSTLDVFALQTTQQQTGVVARLCRVEELVEHLDTGDGGLGALLADADDVDFLVHLDLATLHTTGDDGATTGDREHVLHRHEEGLLGLTNRLRDALVDSVHELFDGLDPLGVAFERLQGRDLDDRSVFVEVLCSEELAHLHLDQLDDLVVINHVGLVQRDQDVRHADLTREQHVLAGLRHRAVGGGDHEDGAVHLRGTGDHVLDVVSVTGGVDVRVVTLLGLVLHVGDVDRDTALTLLGRIVDLVECARLVQIGVLVVQHLGDCCGQRGLAVVNVTDGPDVDVRLRPLELRLRHFCVLLDLLVLLLKQGLIFAVVVHRTGGRSDY